MSWGSWVPSFYARAAIYPPAAVSDALADLITAHPELAVGLDPLLSATTTESGQPKDSLAFGRLRALRPVG
jgi:hypothetical protein